MIALTSLDLEQSILDCGAGPSSFTAGAHDRGYRVTACDPLYRYSAVEISTRIDEIYPVMVAEMEAARDRFA
jgi:predicted RNA methylase